MTWTFLFDTDGTLLDSRRAIVAAVAEGHAAARADLGLPPAPPDLARIADSMGLPSEQYFREAFDPASVPPASHERFAERFAARTAEAEVRAIAAGATALYPGVADTLAELRRRGCRLVVFSNAGSVYFEALVEAHGLDRLCDATLCLQQARERGIAADKTGMVRALIDDPARSVVVGDRIHDITAGRACRARTVGCRYGFGEAVEFARADWVIDAFPELLDIPLWTGPERPQGGHDRS